jgi:transcriptional regulator with XRE-family HTH domain
MFERYPIHALIENRRKMLRIRGSELARRCGFKNFAKGLRRIENVFHGDLDSPSAKTILAALPAALEIEASEVEKAVKETTDILF